MKKHNTAYNNQIQKQNQLIGILLFGGATSLLLTGKVFSAIMILLWFIYGLGVSSKVSSLVFEKDSISRTLATLSIFIGGLSFGSLISNFR